jgi:methionine salvage enolase-phosphatase E1
VCFVSDVEAELDAAQGAGMQTALCVRGDDATAAPKHRVVRTLAELS